MTVEPFIYNRTTYMPVIGTANLAGMDVTWDGATKSVYLWDEMTANDTYLLDVCKPYSFDFPNGKTVKTVELESECMPKKVKILLNQGLQLKIIANEIDWDDSLDIGNH